MKSIHLKIAEMRNTDVRVFLDFPESSSLCFLGQIFLTWHPPEVMTARLEEIDLYCSDSDHMASFVMSVIWQLLSQHIQSPCPGGLDCVGRN